MSAFWLMVCATQTLAAAPDPPESGAGSANTPPAAETPDEPEPAPEGAPPPDRTTEPTAASETAPALPGSSQSLRTLATSAGFDSIGGRWSSVRRSPKPSSWRKLGRLLRAGARRGARPRW